MVVRPLKPRETMVNGKQVFTENIAKSTGVVFLRQLAECLVPIEGISGGCCGQQHKKPKNDGRLGRKALASVRALGVEEKPDQRIQFVGPDRLRNVVVHACRDTDFAIALHGVGRHGNDG